jgi:uncharacterized protein with ParB-like and HNH nuclease domain/predicted transport protein
MKAKQANLLKFLQVSRQFVIPIYQRTYSWKEGQCAQLFDDVLRTSKAAEDGGHFVGSVVYFEESLHTSTEVSEQLIIDGQQRVTTVTLLLAALAELARRHDGLLETTTATKLQNYYLFNAEEEGPLRYKLVLTRGDKDALVDTLDQKPSPPNSTVNNVHRNYNYFQQRLTPQNARQVYAGLQRLFIVDVALERGVDNPQLIFESMNSTGLELSQADLIRNYVLMGQTPKLQTRLYEHYWFPMEQLFGGYYAGHFDNFVRHYLTLRTGQIPRIGEVYGAYKSYLQGAPNDPAVLEAKLRELHHLATCYVRIALPKRESSPRLAHAFADLRELRVDTATPFLLEVYTDYLAGNLTEEEHEEILRLVEAYVFRRVVCDIPTNSLNKTFARLGALLRKQRYVESVKAALQLKDSYKRFPDDSEFERELQVKAIYNLRLCHYLLDKLENFGSKEKVPTNTLSIEHVMPQNPNLSAEWRAALGSNWEQVQRNYLHTLGNLTLTAYNPKLSDRSFEYKKTVEHGFLDSPLRLNKSIAQETEWNEESIQKRAAMLISKALEAWASPKLPDIKLADYRRPESPANYNLDQFQHLTGAMKKLFEALQQQVFQQHPEAKQEVKKLYIAFKADTNFVDVVPQKSRLRLALNLPFTQLKDPNGLAKDVTGLGRWGNGDVEVGLDSEAKLDEVMKLIQQAYQWQLVN